MRVADIAKRLTAVFTAAVIPIFIPPVSSSADAPNDIFYEDFNGDSLDTGKWLIAEKNWAAL